MSNLFYGFLLLITFYVNEINSIQRFAEQPKYTEVNPGEDTLLTCKIIDKAGTCSWQKDNKPVGIYAKKYEWAGSVPHIHLQPPYNGGDCSLWIRSATLDFDDGLWECQVTASDFTAQDALTSQPVRLVVRIKPQRPRLEYEGVHVPPGHNITVDTGAVATVKCISHYGNPPALIKWFLGDQEISPLGPQINSTEPDNRRTWSSTSVVQIPALRERHEEVLKCLALHESYAAKSVSVEARMDIKYAPTIRLIGAPEIDLEEGKDALIMRCVADANPSASIVWRRAGRSEIASLQESLQLRPVGRRDAGLYTCQAQNSVGTSEQLSLQLDVKYAPRILSAGPDRLTTAPLFSPAAFECVAEGNPPPTYKWVQRIAQGTKYLERGNQARLVIDNVTYDYQGEYECRATNFINGQERSVTSEPVSLQVVGAPQVLRLNPSMHTVSVKRGESASLSLVVCADPRPHHVAWEWGSLRLEAGAAVERYRADEVMQDSREDCYLATLHIINADEHDARPYYLVVENERGTDRHAVHLSVEEPLEMSYLLGIAGGCLAALFILVCLCIYAVRGKKCCFKSSSGYKSSDKDSEKADLKSRSDSTSGPQTDSIYTTPAGFHHQHHHHSGHGSPEAMKSTTTLLHNGTIWHSNHPNYFIHEENLPRQIQEQQTIVLHKTPILLRRTATSTGSLYHPNSVTDIDGNQITNNLIGSGELLLGTQRHQRDLFTGDLGIPEITTRVGSVIHTFETMAMLRRNNEIAKNRLNADDRDDLIDLEDIEKKKSIKSKSSLSKSKYNQLKKKSIENRTKFASLAKQNINSTIKTPNPNEHYQKNLQSLSLKSKNEYNINKKNDEIDVSETDRRNYIVENYESVSPTSMNINLDEYTIENDLYLSSTNEFRQNDDFRQNQFKPPNDMDGKKIKKRKPPPPPPQSAKYKQNINESDDEEIINQAFDSIFTNYGNGEDDDDDDNDNNNNDNNLINTNQITTKQTINNLMETNETNQIKRSTLTEFIERAKNLNTTLSPSENEKNKFKSSTLLRNDKTKIQSQKKNKAPQPPSKTSISISKYQKKYIINDNENFTKNNKNKNNKNKIVDDDDDDDFLRGSTVSQSFIKNVIKSPSVLMRIKKDENRINRNSLKISSMSDIDMQNNYIKNDMYHPKISSDGNFLMKSEYKNLFEAPLHHTERQKQFKNPLVSIIDAKKNSKKLSKSSNELLNKNSKIHNNNNELRYTFADFGVGEGGSFDENGHKKSLYKQKLNQGNSFKPNINDRAII